jgi:hypothetical protein
MMAFDLNVFASEFGIDPATLQSKPEAFAKWNGYLTEADGKYASALQAQKDAQAKLDAVQNEQQVIDDKINSFTLTEAEVDSLRANYAALEAQAKTLKAQGYNLTIPDSPVNKTVDPAEEFRGKVTSGFSTMGQVIKATTKYQQVYGKALPDDIDALIKEAAAHRMSVDAYSAQKYDFAGEEKRQAQKVVDEQKAAWQAEAVKKYQDEHPVTAGNHELNAGGSSRFPELAKRPTPQKHENYGGNPAQRIIRSVKRSLEGLAATS